MRLLAKLLLVIAASLTLSVGGPASALDPARSVQQYKHTRWTADDGAPPALRALAQGADGYLWIGSATGLYRFDGVAFERIALDRPRVNRLSVSSILVAADGAVWAGYADGGLSVFRGGVFRDAGMPRPDAFVMAIVQTRDNVIWTALGRLDAPLVRYSRGRWEEIGESWGLPRERLVSILAARDGTLWVATGEALFFLKGGAQRFQRAAEVPTGHASLAEDAAGRIWSSDATGSHLIADSLGPGVRRLAYPTPEQRRNTRTFFDRDGNLWGLTRDAGFFRVRSPRSSDGESGAAAEAVDHFRQQDGLASDNVRAMLEDREGNVWVASALGLDQFRAASVVVEPALTKTPRWGDSLLGASDGTVYIGEADTVYRVRPHGRPEPFLRRTGEVQAICEGPDKAVWVVLQDVVVRIDGERITRGPGPGKVDQDISDCAVDAQNTLWLTAIRDGMIRRVPGGWERVMTPPAQGGFAPTTLIANRGRRLLVASSRSLAWVDFPKPAEVIIGEGAGLNPINVIFEAPESLLFGGGFGLAEVRGGRVRQLSAERHPALRDITGLLQTAAGETWLIGLAGIVRLSADRLDAAFADPNRDLQPMVLDFRDGLPSIFNRDGKRDVVRGGDGRLWFATSAGTVWVDPGRLSRNPLAPRVVISALKAGGVTHRDPTRVTLPKGASSGEIGYTALSLTMPDRVQFRYRLEGMDRGWVDPGPRRQMFFTNLGPGTYRFRVIAANNDGVWNRQGATLEFTIPPTFVQSKWFLLLCALLVGAVLSSLYVMRLRQVTARVRAGLEVRLAERERIARELHDTLLQGFQGLVLRFQSVADRIPPDQPLRPIIDDVLDRADAVLVEGRDRVHELRHTAMDLDLAQALTNTAGELAADRPVRFNLTVEGKPRELHPMVREEVQRMGEEAIRNAFQHARASTIEVAIAYRRDQLRLDVRDDGVGLSDEVAQAGERPGHYGLIGMRERALRIGGLLNVISRKGAGTEILLSVPGRSAYAARQRRWRMPLLKPDIARDEAS